MAGVKIKGEFVGLEESARQAAKAAGKNLKINLGSSVIWGLTVFFIRDRRYVTASRY